MKSLRPLLCLGNGKLGQSIFHFDLPAVSTCPGRSGVCEQVCYATHGRFRLSPVKERLRWNYQQSQRADFVERMVREIHRKGVLVVRLHVSGDFYDSAYATKWLEVMRRGPQVKFYFYTRSWRIGKIAAVLEQMAALPCCRCWYSFDAETGIPTAVPIGVRLAYLQAEEGDTPERANLMFRVRRLRRSRLPLSVEVCPNETPQGRAGQINCGNCQRCWQ